MEVRISEMLVHFSCEPAASLGIHRIDASKGRKTFFNKRLLALFMEDLSHQQTL